MNSDVLSILTSRFEAIKSRDAEKIMGLIELRRYTKFDDWPPFKRMKMDGFEEEKAALKVLKEYVYKIEEPIIEVNGDTAWATFYLSYAGVIRDMEFAIKSRATVILVKTQGEWKIVHEHYSRIPGLEPTDLLRGAEQIKVEEDLLEKRILEALADGSALTAIEISERIGKVSGEKVEPSEVARKCRELVERKKLEKEGFLQPKYRLKR
ncbi:MAG: nuclear transport factor 2 family protein [Nitrososphaerales archaeon]